MQLLYTNNSSVHVVKLFKGTLKEKTRSEIYLLLKWKSLHLFRKQRQGVRANFVAKKRHLPDWKLTDYSTQLNVIN